MSETPAYVKNLKKESVVQSVINCLTDAMRSKELKPGDRIPPEPELAASMGVARSSVRRPSRSCRIWACWRMWRSLCEPPTLRRPSTSDGAAVRLLVTICFLSSTAISYFVL